MLKYYTAAFGLKVFSINSLTKKAYRSVGNILGSKRRSQQVSPHYFQRADENLRFIEERGGIADGMHVMELGTGWVHWEALFTRLFYDVEVTLFDVWDNRQFDGFIFYASQLRSRMREEIKRTPAEFERAEALLDKVLICKDFDEVYKLLNFRYLIVDNGSLSPLADSSLDLVFSSDVLEHVSAKAVPTLCADLMRVLKPGGYAAHQIVFVDHLTIYDESAHEKHYLSMSDLQWKLFGDNGVQYINRLQPTEFEKYFKDAGFATEGESVCQKCDISLITVADRFKGYSDEDLETSVKRLLLRKPA